MRSLRNGLLTTAALLLTGAAAAPLAGAAGFERVAAYVAGAAHGDGDRWVVRAPSQSTVRVLDEAAGDGYDVPIPCPTVAQRDPLLAVGGGQALVGCSSSIYVAPRPLRLDLASRTWHELPGFDELAARYQGGSLDRGVQVDAIGARWIALTASGYHWMQQLTLDWRTGALGPRPTDATAPDLDDVRLNVPLCAPLRRQAVPPDVYNDQPPFEPLLYAAPYAVTNGAVKLQRCGQSAKTTLDADARYMGGAGALQLSGGVVSWSSRKAHVYLPSCALRLSWSAAAGWLHTPRSLYRSLYDTATARWTIARAVLPTCASATSATRVASGGRAVAATTVAGSWPSVAGSTAQVVGVPVGRPPRLRVAPGAAISIRPATVPSAVRWRIGDGAWRTAARRAARRWQIDAPRTLLGSRSLTVRLIRDGSEVRQRVTLTR